LTTSAVVRPLTSPKPFVAPPAWDRIFFSTMSLVILGIVYYGFAHSYFLAGTVRAPLPNVLIHIHGAVFTSWIVLLLIQNALVVTHNVRIHRKLGMWGFGLAASMFVLGLLAGVDAMRRGVSIWGLDPQAFLAIPVTDITLFAVLIYAAFRARSKPEAHKRLILIATLAITDAAMARFPIAAFQQHIIYQDYLLYGLLLTVAAYDLISLRRISRTTLWASALVVLSHVIRIPLGQSAAWHSFTSLFLSKG
jgi:hypothetical protein